MREEKEIIKETREDGGVVFKDPDNGEEIVTYEVDLYSFINDWIGRIKTLVDLLSDEYYAEFGIIVESILENSERQIDEAFDFISKEIGSLEISAIMRGQDFQRTGRVVAVSLEPPKKGGTSNG